MQARWPAAIPSRSGRTAKYSGDLVLTDRRLIFDPREIPETLSPLVAPYVREAITAAMRPLPLGEIHAVHGDERRRRVIHVSATRGGHRYLLPDARDDAVAAIAAAARGS